MIIIFPNLHKWKKILQYDMLLFNILIIILKKMLQIREWTAVTETWQKDMGQFKWVWGGLLPVEVKLWKRETWVTARNMFTPTRLVRTWNFWIWYVGRVMSTVNNFKIWLGISQLHSSCHNLGGSILYWILIF
jgi:hypothetical protein